MPMKSKKKNCNRNSSGKTSKERDNFTHSKLKTRRSSRKIIRTTTHFLSNFLLPLQFSTRNTMNKVKLPRAGAPDLLLTFCLESSAIL